MWLESDTSDDVATSLLKSRRKCNQSLKYLGKHKHLENKLTYQKCASNLPAQQHVPALLLHTTFLLQDMIVYIMLNNKIVMRSNAMLVLFFKKEFPLDKKSTKEYRSGLSLHVVVSTKP